MIKNDNNAESFDYILPAPVGSLGLSLSGKGIRRLAYVATEPHCLTVTHGLALEVSRQLEEYFQLRRTAFDLPIDIDGTPYQNRVWQVVADIAYGQCLTYGDIAEKIHSGPRAVGNACRQNPVPIIIPCHRVVSKNNIGGYCGRLAGRRIQQKDWLLRHEAAGGI